MPLIEHIKLKGQTYDLGSGKVDGDLTVSGNIKKDDPTSPLDLNVQDPLRGGGKCI